MQDKKFTERLKQRLTIEFQNQDRSGAYGFTQRSMAYNSNKIEGSTLTERQTASLFDTGTFFSDDEDTIFRAKDVEEMNGHFKMFNYMMKHTGERICGRRLEKACKPRRRYHHCSSTGSTGKN